MQEASRNRKSFPPELESGIRLLKLGMALEAAQIFQAFLKKQPRHADALHCYGLALNAQGKHAEASEQIAKAINREPGRATFHLNLALCLAAQGNTDAAIKQLRISVQLQPDLIDAWFNMAVLHSQQQNSDAAEACYRTILKLNPRHLPALNNLGDLLAHTDRRDEGIKWLRSALEANPGFTDAQFNLARLVLDEHPSEAVELLGAVLHARPAFIDAHRLHAKALAKDARHELARDALEHAISIAPNNADLRNDLGLVHLEMGSLTHAQREFEHAIRLEPKHGYALYNLAFAVKASDNPTLLAKIQGALNDQTHFNQEVRAMLHFAEGHLLEAGQDYDGAFQAFERANQLKQITYNAGQTEAFFNAIQAVFTPDLFASQPPETEDALPVFIVGMPRSGTTLVEQIVASHAQVEGAGELLWMNQLANGLKDRLATEHDFPASARALTPPVSRQLAQAYLGELRRRGGEQAFRISDKMPGNFVNLGLIALLLSKAKIIHCQRDPLDTCLSCFTSNFTGYLPYAYSLEALGHYYRAYQRLMSHWEQILPLPIHTVVYEQLIADPEAEIRKLIGFLDLPWDAHCLSRILPAALSPPPAVSRCVNPYIVVR